MASLEGKEFTIYRGINGKITALKTALPTLGPKDVLVKITHSGVCYTDNECFRAGAPLSLGHEGVGTVVAIGPSVTQFAIGDRAGGGFHRDSCGHCEYCLKGDDIYCYDRVIYSEGDYDNGTFGEYYVGKESYVHKIPEGMLSEHAAPLQCAGATVYNALVDVVKGPTQRVGIVGIGGLGHLAIQFAAKMGAEVVVFSTSADKEKEAREFGASEFILLGELEKLSKPINVLIIAGSKYPDWDKFLVKDVLARNSTIVPLSAPTSGPITLPAAPCFWHGYHLHSSLVASRARHDDMLTFAARHGVKPQVELYEHTGADSIEKILARLESNKVRYRAVLVAKE